MHDGRKTLSHYTIEEEHKHPGASGEFSGLLDSLATSIKIISNQVSKGALIGAWGNAAASQDNTAVVNVQGDDVHRGVVAPGNGNLAPVDESQPSLRRGSAGFVEPADLVVVGQGHQVHAVGIGPAHDLSRCQQAVGDG